MLGGGECPGAALVLGGAGKVYIADGAFGVSHKL